VVALGPLNVQGERGEYDRPYTAQSITQRLPTKGKCWPQGSKKGMNNKVLRGKQIRAKWGVNNVGLPLCSRQH
jgi:hypothetical protein